MYINIIITKVQYTLLKEVAYINFIINFISKKKCKKFKILLELFLKWIIKSPKLEKILTIINIILRILRKCACVNHLSK